MLSNFLRLELATQLGVMGFIIAMINLLLRFREMYKTRLKIDVKSITPPQEIIFKIRNGSYFNKTYDELFKGKYIPDKERVYLNEELNLRLLYLNSGGEAVQIINQLLYVKDEKNNIFYQIPLKYSTDFDYEENSKKRKYSEIIDLQPGTTIEKTYKVNVSNGNTISMESRKKYGNAIVILTLSNFKDHYFKVRL